MSHPQPEEVMKAVSARARGFSVCLLTIAMIFAVYRVRGQQSTAQVPAPTIRVTTHMVLVDVVVIDKQGKPALGLHPEDFVVEENGKLQKIVTFVPSGEQASADAPALPPGIYSNRPQYRSPGPATVMLLDAINTPFKDQAYARRQMLRFIQEQYKPGQRMAVFTLTGPLNELQDFTTDPQILHVALQRYMPRPQEFASAAQPTTTITVGGATAPSTVAALDPGTVPAGTASSTFGPAVARMVESMQQALQSFEGAQAAYAEDQRAILTLNALNSLARILGGLPGRKNLIWVTGNLPFSLIPENRSMTDAELTESLPSLQIHSVGQHAAGNQAAMFRQSHAGEIRETAARLASGEVAIYPIDARGLSISTAIDSQETMREMARETGGRAYVNQNEIRMGVERAFEDQSATYTLGYYPENKKYDGKYRQLKVKVKRDGVDVQSRRGYFAIDPTQMKGYDPNQELASALGDVVPATLVTFRAQAKPSANGKLGVDFLVDADTLSTEDGSNGGKKFSVSFFAALYSASGKMLKNESIRANPSVKAEDYKQILQHGMMVHMDLDQLAEAKDLRLAVRDDRTGYVGTINAPVPAH